MQRLIYAARAKPTPPKTRVRRAISLESLDRADVFAFDGVRRRLLAGVEGLLAPPTALATDALPGVDGATLTEVSVLARPITLQVGLFGTAQQIQEDLTVLRRILRRPRVVHPDGSCRLVCVSAATGVREMTVTLVAGLEGREVGEAGMRRLALQLLALDPYARDRDARPIAFPIQASAGPFLSDTGNHPWPRRLSSTSLTGGATPVTVVVASDAPVWPRLDFVGPLDALVVDASTGLHLDVPAGVPAGSTLTVVTDPRAKSIRLNGAPAAGRLARGSRLGSPMMPGANTLSVQAGGATAASEVVVSWRGAWESLL